MNKQTLTLDLRAPGAIDQAVNVVRSGGVIAFPTDTVYGIGVSAFNPDAIDKIYQVKGRSQLKAIPILIAGSDELDQITPPRNPAVQKVVDHFWPGALTLVLPMLPDLPGNLSPSPTVGLRVPDHSLVRDLLRKTGPLAATSANLSGQPSALNAEEVNQQLKGRIDLILDGGPAPGGQASTVLDCTVEKMILLREGPIPWNQIADLIS